MLHTIFWNDTRIILVSYFEENDMVRQEKFSFFQVAPDKFMLMDLQCNNRVDDESVYNVGDSVDLSELFQNFYSDTETFTITLIEKE